MPKKIKTPTEFQVRVYDAVRRIPKGKVASYAAVASAIACRSARVIGQALRACPFDDVPCHRVVASDLTVGGFAGRSVGPDVERKKRLLAKEGVRFDQAGRIEPAHALRDSPGLRLMMKGGAYPKNG